MDGRPGLSYLEKGPIGNGSDPVDAEGISELRNFIVVPINNRELLSHRRKLLEEDPIQKDIKRMEIQSGATADSLFSAIYQSSSSAGYLATASMSRGIDLYQKGNYDDSIKDFKRVIAVDPNSDNAVKAYSLLGAAYTYLNRTDDAIDAYKAAVRISPSDDTLHITLGNIYFGQDRYPEAETEYQTAVRLNSQSVTNWYSLGQVYLKTGRYDEAEKAFKKITQISPQSYNGYYGLGQVDYKRADYEEAVQQFQKVSEMKRDFAYVHVDLGYAYADMGDTDNASQQVKILNEVDPASANLLRTYLYKTSHPKFLAAYPDNGFNVTLGPGTALSSLDPSLSNAHASKNFTMNFIFSKDMDTASVQNPYNWNIMRAPDRTPGSAYNWGLPIPSTETQVVLFPKTVVFDPDSLIAQVTFQVKQNASADGTIDPSHIMFKFSGADVYGNAMDPAADEYSGISVMV